MTDLITNLGINWKLIIAQIVNFAILVFILNKFLYQPILNTLEKRKRNAEEGEELRKNLHLQMEEVKKSGENVLLKARQEADKIIEDTKKQALVLKDKLNKEAEQEAEKIKQEAKKNIDLEKDRALNEVKREIGSVISLAIDKSMGDVLDKNTQNKLADKALTEINK